MRDALEAALRVRKARKKAKREKARENGKKLVQGVRELRDAIANGGEGLTLHTPKPLTIEAGKSYRTRDGMRVLVMSVSDEWIIGRLNGLAAEEYKWHPRGYGFEPDMDLIAEWQDD